MKAEVVSEIENMYGYVKDNKSGIKDDMILKDCDEYEQLKSQYPEHEVYLFLGTDVDMALFVAPGVSAMLIETRASPDKIF